ncbi:class A beta-lactamase, subclass A2 [Parapedobacter sp. ISTM3]|uniref:class A beta-lactamase, subclass A2 n=1 Tax=Parapedobacter sp. ISTM3 TaxID=2800130 RepID=UPI00351C35A7
MKMLKKMRLLFLLGLLVSAEAYSQSIATLRRQIAQIADSKDAVVGVAITGRDGQDTLSVYGSRRFPMQSVFKFPIAVAMLSEVDKGTFSLDQKITIKKSELLPGIYSPIRETYPEGATLTIAEILRYTVSLSDNVGCDVLLRLLGSPQEVERYFHERSFKEISIKINEEIMQGDWEAQFRNWTTPNEANRILQACYENRDNLLSPESYDFLWGLMKTTETGKNRLKGQLPEGTVVAHKTGWSGRNEVTGITAAVNNIGVVFLPDGNYFYISVFVTDSKEDLETNERIIADIAKAAWDYFARQ